MDRAAAMDGFSKNFFNIAALQQAMGYKPGPPTLPFDIHSLQAGLYPGLNTPRSPGYGVMEMAGEAAEARLVDYRGEKVAGFEVDGETLICLPQAFELFLKNLVGGLHTVYTKLKRLEITPKVCNVEQVRALRSLGAIQPGVNRCKLIACKDFDVLFEDCTNANCSARPGRPPKRSPVPFPSTVTTPMVTKKPKVEGFSEKPSPGWGGAAGPSSVFPFMPLTPQQVMLSQFLNNANSSAAIFKHFHQAGTSANPLAEPSGVPDPKTTDHLSDDATHSDPMSSPNGAVNLSKTASASPGPPKPFAPQPSNQSQPEAHTNGLSDDYYSDPESSPGEREPTVEMKSVKDFAFPTPSSSELFHEQMPGYSAESLLTQIRGLIDFTSMLMRKEFDQLDQARKDHWEARKLLDQERREKQHIQDQLTEALRAKALYRRRWKCARRHRPSAAPPELEPRSKNRYDPSLSGYVHHESLAGSGLSGPGLSGSGLSGPGLSGPGLSGPGLSGSGLSGLASLRAEPRGEPGQAANRADSGQGQAQTGMSQSAIEINGGEENGEG